MQRNNDDLQDAKGIDELNRDYYEIRRKSNELSQKFEAFKNRATERIMSGCL